MKKNFYSALFLLFSLQAFAQQHEIYLNDNLHPISKSEYDAMSDWQEFFGIQFTAGDTLVNVKVQRLREGMIDPERLDSIRSEIAGLSGEPIPESNFLLIKYHFGTDPCLETADPIAMKTGYRKFAKKLKQQGNVTGIFMYQSPEGTAIYGEGLQWVEDRTGIVAMTFFPISYPCGGLVIIDPNGKYYLVKGPYSSAQPFKLLKKLQSGK